MVDRKDILTDDGDVHEDILNAVTVVMAGLGIIKSSSEEKRKKSAEATRIIGALYAKRKMEQEKADQQLYEAQIRREHEALMQLHRKDKPNK